MKKTRPRKTDLEIECPACGGTGFPPIIQRDQARSEDLSCTLQAMSRQGPARARTKMNLAYPTATSWRGGGIVDLDLQHRIPALQFRGVALRAFAAHLNRVTRNTTGPKAARQASLRRTWTFIRASNRTLAAPTHPHLGPYSGRLPSGPEDG
jgi:hypothetical protein